MCSHPIPRNYPVVGDDAFRTATGVHAAAIIKAYHKNDVVLANCDAESLGKVDASLAQHRQGFVGFHELRDGLQSELVAGVVDAEQVRQGINFVSY